jgi:deoxyribonuclease V
LCIAARPIGAALCTKTKINPVFVSPGHKCDLESAISLLLRCDGGWKIPEPTRRAHNFVNRCDAAKPIPTTSKNEARF